MEAILLFSERGALLTDPEKRHFQIVPYAHLSRVCSSYPFLRLFSDRAHLSFSLMSLPFVPFWQREQMIRLNLQPALPSYWTSFSLTSWRDGLHAVKQRFLKRKQNAKRTFALFPFQYIAQPLCLTSPMPSSLGVGFVGGEEPLLLGLPSLCVHLLGRPLGSEEWWIYGAPHTLSGWRLVVGKGKGLFFVRTLPSSDLKVVAAGLEDTLRYLPRLGWREETLWGLFIEAPKLSALGKSYAFLNPLFFSLTEAAKKLGILALSTRSLEELLLRWILKKHQHFPCLGPSHLRRNKQLLLFLKGLRPTLYGLSCACCLGTAYFCFQARLSHQQIQERQEYLQQIEEENAQLEGVCANYLQQSNIPLDVATMLTHLADVEKEARFLERRKRQALIPQLEKLAALFSIQTPTQLVLSFEKECVIICDTALLPQEMDAFCAQAKRLFPAATVVFPQEPKQICLMTNAAPARTSLKVEIRSSFEENP
ncbi:MAG: hypothetical protein LBD66_00770 [Holosporales bacterium]|jgi:hypothetical protein|nr:hypothetical protein [Holosporales bacterium]